MGITMKLIKNEEGQRYYEQADKGRSTKRGNGKRKIVTAILLITALSAVQTVGCGKEQNAAADGSGESRSSTEKPGMNDSKAMTEVKNKKLSIAWSYDGVVAANFDSLDETPLGEQWKKDTGVDFTITHYDLTPMNLMMASGELPDIIMHNFTTEYSGGIEKAVQDGVIRTVPYDMMKEHAPDYLKVMEDNGYRRDITADTGELYGFAFLRGTREQCTYIGTIIRDDWLEKLNLDLPETAEEFYDTLTAFRDHMGATVPFSTTSDYILDQFLGEGSLTSAFGLVKASPYQKDGTVRLGYAEEEYKDCLAYLNRLYEEGLLDNSFTTLDGNTQNANLLSGASGVMMGYVNGGIGSMMANAEKTDPEFDLTGLGSLAAAKGGRAMSGHYDYPVNRYIWAITPACKDVETALEFLNYGYTEEGHMLLNFGIEGKSYELVNGEPVYTEWITNNPDGLTMQLAMSYYCRAFGTGPCSLDDKAIKQYAARPQQQEAYANWSDNDAEKYNIPPAAVVSEQYLSEYGSLTSDIQTYVDEMSLKFIRGIEPLDEFDDYLKTLKEMGTDRLTEIIQDAYDRYSRK